MHLLLVLYVYQQSSEQIIQKRQKQNEAASYLLTMTFSLGKVVAVAMTLLKP